MVFAWVVRHRWWFLPGFALAGWLVVGTWLAVELATYPNVKPDEPDFPVWWTVLFSYAVAIPVGMLPGCLLGLILVATLTVAHRQSAASPN